MKVLADSDVMAHIAVTTTLPVLDCLYYGCNVCRADVWGEGNRLMKNSPSKEKHQRIEKLSASWVISIPVLVSHHNPLHTATAHPRWEKRPKRCNGFYVSVMGVLQFQSLSINLLLKFTYASVKRFHFVFLLHEFRSRFSKQNDLCFHQEEISKHLPGTRI